MIRRFLTFWRNIVFKERVDHDLEEEINSYVELVAADTARKGVSRDAAMQEAYRDLGGLEQLKENVRDIRTGAAMDIFVQDLRYAIRSAARNPVFSVVAVLTLALGIGVNAGIFSVVNGVLLNPLPYPHPEQLVSMHESKPNFPTGSISFPNFKDWKKNNRTFSDMAISRPDAFSLTGTGEPERLQARLVSSDFFTVLGVNPVLGRNFANGEDEMGAAPVAMISSSLWQRKLGGAANIIGRVLRLDDRGYTVIGIVPRTFDLLTESFRTADVYVPIGQWNNSALQYRSAGLAIHGFGRLKPGVTIEQARADMASVTNALGQQYPADDKGVGASLISLKEEMLGGIRPILLMLLGAVVFVLLIACVNVANLLLARANGRAREVAIRCALGAGAGRLVRQLLTESILLALLGAGLGLVITSWGTHAALIMLPTVLPRAGEIVVDHRVLAFTIGISLLSGILFGLVPALKMMRTDLQGTLKEGARGASGPKQRTQGVFVILEIAMALVLLAGAGLMIRSMAALWRVDPGFQSEGVLQFGLSLPPSMARSSPEAVRAALRETQARFAATPGVSAVSLSWGALPMGDDDEELFWMKGQPKPSSEADMNWALRYAVGPDYLKVMRIALLKGRFLNNHDDNHAPMVVVVDEELARKFFGDVDPIGQRLELTDPKGEAEIVGVVAHVKQWGLDIDDKQTLRAELYLPILQQVDPVILKIVPGMDVLARCTSSPTPVFEALRRTSAAMSGEQVIYGQETMNEVIAGTIAARRFAMVLLGVFAALALALAMMGVYGVTSYSVGRRTNEIGIRMALGAKRSGVFRLVLGEGMRLAMIGTAVGIAAALVMTQWLAGLLFGVSAHDPLTLLGVAIILSTTVALASWIPARRAMRVDPMVALRHE